METEKPNAKATAGCLGRLVLRWKPEQIDEAAGIVNDIAEEIDNGETRKQLRQALAIYADMLYDALQAKAQARDVAVIAELEKINEKLNAQNTEVSQSG